MKGLAVCNKGIEDVTALDVHELISQKSESGAGFVTFEIASHADLCKLSYWGQCVSKVMLVLDEYSFDSFDELSEKIKKNSVETWLTPGRTFRVDVSTHDEVSTQDLREIIGGVLVDAGTKAEVKLANPDVLVHIFLSGKKAFLGIDFSGIDLSKRVYRVYSNPRGIKSTLAYALVRLTGYTGKETLVDPFCLVGSIPIEAALWACKHPARFFNREELAFLKFMTYEFEKPSEKETTIIAIDSQFRNVDSAKKNAKIAGVHKFIQFSRQDVEWLDVKYTEGELGLIATCLPTLTKEAHTQVYLKIIKEFFHQAEYVLAKKGKIALLTKNPDVVKKEAAAKGFKVSEERKVWQGKEEISLLVFGR
ncbi:MAG: THUMP domain-containing protein [Nanoarchaeota archaeon]|nr:THUMP domain-containing protein [Nanoarchaeota archaeon]